MQTNIKGNSPHKLTWNFKKGGLHPNPPLHPCIKSYGYKYPVLVHEMFKHGHRHSADHQNHLSSLNKITCI